MAAAVSPVALVTGASRGIGRGIAQQLARQGARLALHYHRNRDAAEATLASLAGAGHASFPAALGDPAACARLIASVHAHFGRIDILVNNAGIYEEHDPRTVTFATWEQSWREVIDANLIGPAHLSFLAAQHMRTQADNRAAGRSAGRIVNISSRGAFRGEPEAPGYGAAKAGLNALGQSLAKALAPDDVHVFTVAPGWVATDMAQPHLDGPGGPAILAQHPLGRVTSVEEVARVAAWLALDAPAAMTGAIIDVNGASYLRT